MSNDFVKQGYNKMGEDYDKTRNLFGETKY